MITYKLFSLYYATLNGQYHAHGETRELAIMLALMKAYRDGKIK